MNVPATATQHSHAGLKRSAALMRALGASAQPLWERLSPQEANQLSQIMQNLPDTPNDEYVAVEAYLQAVETSPNPAATHEQDVWEALTQEDPSAIAALLDRESPQIVAVILSQLEHDSAARIITTLPKALAVEVLRRILYLEDIHPNVMAVIEHHLAKALKKKADHALSGHEHLARIFDQVDSKTEESLLYALDDAEPGAREKVRALMFTFEDLAGLDPASLQTLLSNIDREILIRALKGAKEHVTQAFMKNMTQRAGQLLAEEIASSGPVRRSELEAARTQIANKARTLIKRGDMLSHDEDDELVE